MVENRGSRAMGIFAVVLVVINFIHSPNSKGISQQSIALTTTLLASGFLMIAFIVEVYGGLNDFIFKLQEDSLNYAGLLLFSGLYFVVDSISGSVWLSNSVLFFVLIAWAVWLFYKLDYLFVVQRNEWNAISSSRREYLRKSIQRFVD